MSRLSTFTSLSIGLVPVLVLSGACGHTEKTLDAYYEAQKQAPSTGNGNGESNPNVFPDSAYANVPSCTPPTRGLPQFDCMQADSLQFDKDNMKGYCVPDEVKTSVDSTIASMTAGHKAIQMLGIPEGKRNYRDIERSPDVTVPGIGEIRGYRYRDAGRGVNLDAGQDNRPDDKKNYATAFPAPSLRAASWDLNLERRIGSAIGDETAASLNNMNLGPCMNIVRHPYWGRTQETYGEDSYSIGRMSTAYSVGVQEYVVGCAKHFAANNIEFHRSQQNAVMSEQTLREIYGRHFEMIIQDGSMGCIMAAYNLINGEKATQSEHLLRDILKAPVSEGGMGFEGLVITDWWAMPGDQVTPDAPTALADTIQAVKAGTDIEVPWQMHYSEATLAAADQTLVEDAARRVLTQKFLFNSAKSSQPWSKKKPTSVLPKGAGSLKPNDAHENLTEEAVVKSAVLLVNGLDQTPVLPLKEPQKIAVIGADQAFKQISSSVPPTCGYSEDVPQGVVTAARECTFNHGTDPALGDRGSSRVNGDPSRSVGPFKGIKQIGENEFGATVTSGKTAADAMAADTVVVIVGYTPGDEGEEYYIAGGGDRTSLDLPPGQNDLVQSVLDLQKPTVIIIQSGSVVNLPWLEHSNKNQATFWAGYPGMRAGLAYGQLIFGKANFAGKMPMAWPEQDQLAALINFKPDGDKGDTTMDYFFGYRLYDKLKYIDKTDVNLVFPFGHGLSYSTFEYENLGLPCETAGKEGIFEVTVDVKNTSAVAGDEVVFLFIKPPAKPDGVTGERPWKELKSFARVTVLPMDMETVRLPVRVHDLRRWEGGEDGHWVIDSGAYTIAVGKDAEAAEAEGALTGTVMVAGD